MSLVATVELALVIVGAYLGVGLLIALAFAFLGVHRTDSAAEGAPLQFRLIILPAAMALWPIILGKWLFGRRSAEEEGAS